MDEMRLYGLLVCCRPDGMLAELPLSEDRFFLADGYLEETEPHTNALFGIVKTADGYIYRGLGDQKRICFNGVLADESVVSSTLGSGIKKLAEGDVITIRDEHDAIVEIIVFHERMWKNIRWRRLALNGKDDVLYISRHEEDIETPEIQSDSEPLPAHYAVLRRSGEGWTVEDHSTIFGVFVNNQHVRGVRQLAPMDVVRIGHTLFLYRGPELIFNHMQYGENQLKINIHERTAGNMFRHKLLLKDISMEINVGEMVLILGGSGAGKTTFINSVMGYEKADGTILSGGKDVYKEYGSVKYDIGFVPQQDLLRMEDTVYDTLLNAAQMKLPANMTKQELDARITEVIETLGLEQERDNLVSKLSGGQRRRLSIAVEYVAKPNLFFLDEPDSGLDGVMARHLMENLRMIADQEKIVIVITHSPDRAADLFDKVVVLAKNSTDNAGCLAFFGNVDECLGFFDTDSLEAVVKRINRKDEGGEGLADEYINKFNEIRNKGTKSDDGTD